MHKIANHAQSATLNILVSRLLVYRKPIPALLNGWTLARAGAAQAFEEGSDVI